jgi:hypothetical protein
MYTFWKAAFPWIVISLFVAVACAWMGTKKKEE